MNVKLEIPHGTTGFAMQFFSEPNAPSPCHYCSNYELLYMADGKMRFGLENKEYIIKKGDIVFIDYEEIHYLLPTEQNDRFHYCPVCFSDSVLGIEEDPCRIFLRKNKINTFLKIDTSLMERMPEELFRIFRKKEPGFQFILKSWLFEVMNEIMKTKQYSKRKNIASSDRRSQTIKSIINYIENHYYEKIYLDDIFSAEAYSSSYLLKLFKKYTNMTVIEFLNKYRINKSREDLIYSDLSITDIGIKNGFDHSHYYTRLFERYHNCTPSEYRKLYKQY